MSEFIGTKLTMNLGERSYDIIIKSGSLENLYQFARLDRRVAVVTDSGVPAQYAQRVADQCKDARIITVPQGEASKSFKILESVLRQMLDFGMRIVHLYNQTHRTSFFIRSQLTVAPFQKALRHKNRIQPITETDYPAFHHQHLSMTTHSKIHIHQSDTILRKLRQ